MKSPRLLEKAWGLDRKTIDGLGLVGALLGLEGILGTLGGCGTRLVTPDILTPLVE